MPALQSAAAACASLESRVPEVAHAALGHTQSPDPCQQPFVGIRVLGLGWEPQSQAALAARKSFGARWLAG